MQTGFKIHNETQIVASFHSWYIFNMTNILAAEEK